jgi:hypothetical protein
MNYFIDLKNMNERMNETVRLHMAAFVETLQQGNPSHLTALTF